MPSIARIFYELAGPCPSELLGSRSISDVAELTGTMFATVGLGADAHERCASTSCHMLGTADLAQFGGGCYTSYPLHRTDKIPKENKVLRLQRGNLTLQPSEKEVDEQRETLHNLSSLLLTNKTIRRIQQGSTEQSSLTINSR
jgi:hypothetical protein